MAVAVAAGALVAPPAWAQAGSWSPTGNMLTGRLLHTLTLLGDGRVLAAGGVTPDDATVTAELYDPAHGTWSATADMHTPRSRHIAIRLGDGRVLVAGGRLPGGGPDATAAAELYDPISATWTPTGTMRIPRSNFISVRLLDGRILVAGGVTGDMSQAQGSFFTNTAEIYDPATGTWTQTAKMANRRFNHRATMLPDGRVLVTGGRGVSGDCVSLQTAEIYDPAAGGWSNTEGMAVGHGIHAAATLPGGRVLVAAGWSQPAAGCGTPTARSEIYAAATGHWTPAADLASPRAAVESAQLADGSLLLAGGLVPTAEDGVAITDTAEVFHVSAGQWVSAGNMSTPRVAQGMVRLADGRILIAGGGSPTGPLSSAEVYTP